MHSLTNGRVVSSKWQTVSKILYHNFKSGIVITSKLEQTRQVSYQITNEYFLNTLQI